MRFGGKLSSLFVLVVALALLAGAALAGEIYRWRDGIGTIHFSDTPPAKGDAVSVAKFDGSIAPPQARARPLRGDDNDAAEADGGDGARHDGGDGASSNASFGADDTPDGIDRESPSLRGSASAQRSGAREISKALSRQVPADSASIDRGLMNGASNASPTARSIDTYANPLPVHHRVRRHRYLPVWTP